MSLWPWFRAAGSHIVQTTAVAVMVWLLVVTVFKTAGPRVRYSLWFAASAKFLVPFSILVSAGQQLVLFHRLPPALHQRLDLTVDQIWSRVPPQLMSSSRLATIPNPPISPL